MRSTAWLCFAICVLAIDARAIVAPADGGPLPRAYYEVKARQPSAFESSRAWVGRTALAGARRAAILTAHSDGQLGALPADARVAGDLRVPVLLARFSGQAAPFPAGDLQAELFDGPWPTGTLTEYYDEVSYGALDATGTVTGWTMMPFPDLYYEGASNGLAPGDARTGELIKAVLDSNDVAVDFGVYDNDGPDGTPNSGDDDGYVDIVFIVHSETGGECGATNNIWSHTWQFSGWPASGSLPYTTNDTSASGGYIKVDDYAVSPGLSCGGGMIEIGGFCHLLGHGLGLPDLYDSDGGLGHYVGGGTSGIGHWGLMGSGNWNAPESPAHPCAWTRQELGWVVPTDIGPAGGNESIAQIETNPECFKLSFSDDRFRRMGECAINGGFSLRCALDATEAAARNWGGSGYGNNWREDIQRDFTYDGSPPVTLSFDYAYDLEFDYDVAHVTVDVAGTETVLATWTGAGSGTAGLDLSAALAGASAGEPYTIHFRVETDFFQSDEDGQYTSACGALVVDDIAVTGGGENYMTGFETSADGWYQSPARNTATEYWLVENRQPVGFDAHLPGAGLVIYHIDEEVLRSRLGNTGGDDNTAVRGIVVEEADGGGHLLQDPATTGNRGDGGDPFPGSTNNTAFDSSATPSSDDNTGRPTRIEVSGISPSGSVMTGFFKAGDPAPAASGVSPAVIDNNLESVSVRVSGADFRAGATLRLTMQGEADIVPLSVYWQDAGALVGELNVYSRRGGLWDLVVTNPDGQVDTLAGAVEIVQIVAAQLVFAELSAGADGVEVRFELFDRDADEKLAVSRADRADGPWRVLEGEPLEGRPNRFVFVDRSVRRGATYHYRLEVISGDGTARELYRGSVVVPAGRVVLEQNYPNPFNPTTTIAYYLPEPAAVQLDIFTVAGALVKTLASGHASAGPHTHVWNGRDERGARVGSGVYVYRLRTGKTFHTRKMLLIK